MRQAYNYWQDQPGNYVKFASTALTVAQPWSREERVLSRKDRSTTQRVYYSQETSFQRHVPKGNSQLLGSPRNADHSAAVKRLTESTIPSHR